MPKIIYNSKEVANNSALYNDMSNKPMINNVELTGNVALSQLNIFPVNSVYASLVKVHPFVGGTWEYIGSINVDGTEIYYYKRVA